MPNITLSVFQALTLLAEKYRHDEHKKNRFDFIKRIYLTGAHTAAYRESLKILLQDPCLKKFNISTSKHDINEDPVRRYFESHLAHNTLEASLDDLDILLLHENFHVIFKLLQRSDHAEFCALISQHPPKPYVFVDEYLDGLFQLHQPKSYRSLSPRETEGRLTPENMEAMLEDRKQKLILIIKCMYASAWVNTQSPHSALPLNVYNHRPESPYSPTNRGRTQRRDVTLEANQEQNVRPHTRGIMRSYMPLPHDDALFADEPSNYTRPADMYTYIDTHYLSTSPLSMPKRIFQNQVTPFVGSISGVMLMQLKVMAILLRRRELPFRAPSESSRNVQLELYIKSFVSYMLYNAGGHSLHEYLDVLNLPIVQDEFQSLSGFSRIELRYLFQKTNVAAFEKTMDQTIAYNNNMIQKKSLHQELKERLPEINTDIDQETKTPPTHYSIFTPIQIEETEENIHPDMIISMPEPHKPQANHSIFSPEPPHDQRDNRIRKRLISAVVL